MILGCQSLEHRMLNADFRSFYFEIQDSSFDIRNFSIHCASAFKIAFIRCRVNMIKLDFTIKETASLLNITPDSVKSTRHVLRTKLGLSTGENIHEFLNDL